MAAKRKSVRTAGRKSVSMAKRKVGKVMHELKQGTLRSGRSGRKVTKRKQAIAIGLAEARKAGARIPKKKSSGVRRAA